MMMVVVAIAKRFVSTSSGCVVQVSEALLGIMMRRILQKNDW